MGSRVISQAGDSTDGEDYEEEDDVAKLNTLLIQYPNYQASCVLKDLGNKILQSNQVRDKYKQIKNKFTQHLTVDEQKELHNFDREIGRGWGSKVTKCDRETLKFSEDAASSVQETRKSMSEADKVNWYQTEKIGVQDKLKRINELNRKITNHVHQNRDSIVGDLNIFVVYEMAGIHPDASSFLARVKACKKIDKDVTKNAMYDFRFGEAQGTTVREYVVASLKAGGEQWDVGTRGGLRNSVDFNHGGSYEAIGERTRKFVETFFNSDNQQFIRYLQAFLMKGWLCVGLPLPLCSIEFTGNYYQALAAYFKLIFRVEVKRNSAALLTNSMFFDLVAANVGDYKVENMHNRMPMAMQGAVSGSVAIDRMMKMEPEWKGKLTSEYDYRAMGDHENAWILARKDDELLQTWLKWKCQHNLDNKITYVKAKVFYCLIDTWYGIKLEYLNVDTEILVTARSS